MPSLGVCSSRRAIGTSQVFGDTAGGRGHTGPHLLLVMVLGLLGFQDGRSSCWSTDFSTIIRLNSFLACRWSGSGTGTGLPQHAGLLRAREATYCCDTKPMPMACGGISW